MIMKKSIKNSWGGRNVKVADFLVNRLLPNEQIGKVGPFVFLDHIYPIVQKSQEPCPYKRLNAHPHRGIATLTYLLSGSIQHFDSLNHEEVVDEGGGHWMKAGKGIVHEERPAPEFQRNGGILHAVQFWINLPSANKKEDPEYLALASGDIRETELPDNAGTLRVLLGKCGELISPVKTFLNEFNYHLKLNPKSEFLYGTKPDLEYAVFVPGDEIHVNGEVTGKSHLLVLPNDCPVIRLYNPGITDANVFIFGGGEYREPIVTEGPFVMNTCLEITHAYQDFLEGKYGTISMGESDDEKKNYTLANS
jgi:redox-sensitive bicupin YhaK (pirin superfamily)